MVILFTFRRAVQHPEPDVILLDVGMPRLSGPDAAQSISQKLPAVRIVMLSMHSDEAYVLRALKAGARGYLLKASPEADVIAAIRAVTSGNAYARRRLPSEVCKIQLRPVW
jgi:two-component system response regulator NreC